MVAPQGFLVDDAQNFICQVALERNVEYLGLIEDDNLVPPNLFLKWRRYMEENAKNKPMASRSSAASTTSRAASRQSR